MAIFESSVKRKPGTRSNTKLVVSGGASPAGQWVTDPNLPILFNYDYGGPGQKEVVVSKGMIVGVAPNRYKDDALGYDKNALTIATQNVRAFGMAPYNFTKHWPDFLDGNQPSVITREYIELPLIGTATDAAAIKWGALYNEDGFDKIKPGDLVTWSRNPQNYGKIIKWDPSKGHGVGDIIGQIGEIETDQEPFGWLKWAMWDEAARKEDQDGPVNKSGYSAPGDAGYPFDPKQAIRDANGNLNLEVLGQYGTGGYLSQYTTEYDATGVPGILDGKNKAQTLQRVETVLPAKDAAGNDHQVGKFVTIQTGYTNIVENGFRFFIDGTEVNKDLYTVENGKGVIRYILQDVNELNKPVRFDFYAEFFGTPAGWDFKGAIGAARILLKF